MIFVSFSFKKIASTDVTSYYSTTTTKTLAKIKLKMSNNFMPAEKFYLH